MRERERFLCVTTLGAYVCVSSDLEDDTHLLLRWLLTQDRAPELSPAWVARLADRARLADPRKALRALVGRRLATVAATPCARPTEPMQAVLPSLLAALSEDGVGLLADAGGLCMASAGLDPEAVETLPALASKLVGALEHADRGLFEALGIEYGLPCLFDLKRRQLVALVPMRIGSRRFVLLARGRSMFLGTAFRDLVWTLWGRYGV